MRFVTVMAGAASASPHGWGHGSGQRSPPMPAPKCPTPRSVVSISTTRLDATQKTNSGKPLRKRPRVHVRHPSQLGPKGTHCSTGFAIRAIYNAEYMSRMLLGMVSGGAIALFVHSVKGGDATTVIQLSS